MTFVAQPYEQFVDDILTALTGGLVREEHRFDDRAAPYAISSAGAIPDSVRVVGQRDGSFRAFTRGLDFEFDQEESAVRWLEGGTPPDERSFFYVNYYPTEGIRRLTDRNPGSVTRILAEAFSRQYAVLHKQMELIYKSAFVEFSKGSDLDQLASLVDITRRDQRYAGGEVLFKRSTPAAATIAIPSGTLVSTPTGQAFETTEERRLRRGQLSVTAPVRARLPGQEGTVPAGSITVLNEPLLGIETLENTEATHFDAERETDEQLRRRIQGAFERAGRSTRNAILRGLIEEIPAVTDGNVRLVERLDQPGLVEIQFGLAEADEDTVRRIDESILRHRAAGVRVIHNLSAPKAGSGRDGSGGGVDSDGVAPATDDPTRNGASNGRPAAAVTAALPEDLAGLPGGVLPLRFEILYRLSDRGIAAAKREEIEDGIRERVFGYVDALGMDSDLIHSKLVGRVVEPDALHDATVRIGVAGRPELHATNLATAGRKAAIADAQTDVFVAPMVEAVTVDVAVVVELQAGIDGDRPAPKRWELAVSDGLADELAGPGASTLTAADVERVVRVALEASPYRVSQRAVSLTVTFEDSGRFLADPQTIDLHPHHDVTFGKVVLEVGNPLDG